VEANFGDNPAKPFEYDIRHCPGMGLEWIWEAKWKWIGINGWHSIQIHYIDRIFLVAFFPSFTLKIKIDKIYFNKFNLHKSGNSKFQHIQGSSFFINQWKLTIQIHSIYLDFVVFVSKL
jgi:hypothetical protein